MVTQVCQELPWDFSQDEQAAKWCVCVCMYVCGLMLSDNASS